MRLFQNKSLKELTTFKIGGKAEYFCSPKTFDEMKAAFCFAKEKGLKYIVLGKGSNILFDDKGFSGVVIHNNINFLRILKNKVYAGAGFSFASLGVQTAYKNLSGLEFAAGVPGSVGGAAYMNASAYGQAVSDTLQKVVYLNEDGSISLLEKQQMQMGYKDTVFQKRKGAVLSCIFELKDDKNAIEKQREIIQKKRKNQPLNEKNAGCVFKNPKGFSAGRLIEECNLKNHMIGGAKVSDHHANFIINEKDASSKDVLNLIAYIKDTVERRTKILLEEEIRIIKP